MTESNGSRRGRPPKSEVETIAPRILAAATEIFLEAGYEQTNMSNVAQKAGCSKRTLYLRFPSKLDLFSAFVKFFVEERIEGIRISIDPAACLEQQLARVFTAVRAYAASEEMYRLHRLIVQDGRRFPELRSILDSSAWEPGNKFMRDLLKSHFADAMEDELSFLAEQFLALAALRPLHHNVVGKSEPADAPEEVVRLFLHGCCSLATTPTVAKKN